AGTARSGSFTMAGPSTDSRSRPAVPPERPLEPGAVRRQAILNAAVVVRFETLLELPRRVAERRGHHANSRCRSAEAEMAGDGNAKNIGSDLGRQCTH